MARQMEFFLVDEGCGRLVQRDDVQVLLERFAYLPPQAIKLHLFGLETYNHRFDELDIDDYLYGKSFIGVVDESPIHGLTVKLFDINGEEKIYMNGEIVSLFLSNQYQDFSLSNKRMKDPFKACIHVTKLGEGGFGSVSLVLDTVSLELCALKRVLLPRSTSEERFQMEVNCLSIFSGHKNFLRFFGYHCSNPGKTGNKGYLMMEFVDGLTLYDYINSTRSSRPAVQSIMMQLGQAVKHIHFHKVIHLDIKPQNIMIDFSFRIKIIDFGLSVFGPKSNKFKRGTPGYMAPEVFGEHEEFGYEADYYSLGVVFYNLLFNCDITGSQMKNFYRDIVDGPVDVHANFGVPWEVAEDEQYLLNHLLHGSPPSRLNDDTYLQAKYFEDINQNQG